MADQEKIAELQKEIASLKKVIEELPKERLGVRLTVEYTGHLSKDQLMAFHTGMGSVIENNVENGSGG